MLLVPIAMLLVHIARPPRMPDLRLPPNADCARRAVIDRLAITVSR